MAELIFWFVVGLPTAERFTFCLNTLLSDIAVKSLENRETILSTQVKFLGDLTSLCQTAVQEDAFISFRNKCMEKIILNFVNYMIFIIKKKDV